MGPFRKIVAVQLFTIAIFAVLKHFRESLAAAFPNPLFEIFLYSFPNFAEGVVGYLITAMLLTLASWNLESLERLLTFPRLDLIAFIIAGTYVIAQEFGLHHFGGTQIYDPFDVAFSLAGLCAGVALFVMLKPSRPQ